MAVVTAEVGETSNVLIGINHLSQLALLPNSHLASVRPVVTSQQVSIAMRSSA